ncbi:MAG TPA: IclR family transcriptional regulator [Hyphomicrobiaceae bacterium]|jgi:IclR family acetate operon transcriptional repressor|nr:IclR family transcriptional regulator [Hyphomicrobiaceae bacterium]
MASGRTETKRAAEAASRRRASSRRAVASGDNGKIQSLKRASAILDAVAKHPGGIGLSQISAAVGLHPSTAFNLIQTLVSLGFVAQLPDSRRYRIGTRLFTLAAGALDETALIALATPILERLSADTGYASHLAVRSQRDIVVIARTAATGLLQLAGHPGATRPAHATAIGKMLLAVMPPDELDRVLKALPLPAFTPRTITDAQALRREIEGIRRTGLARDDCELDRDVRCLAVPVFDFAGRCAAAMGISGPAWRLVPGFVETLAQQLRAAATELSARLGGRVAI